MIPSLHALTHVLRATTVACPPQPRCPINDQCVIVYPENGVTTQLTCLPGLYGGDLGTLYQIATLTGCSRECSRTEGCVAAAYEGLNCYLKSTKTGEPYINKDVIGVTVVDGTPKPYSPAICPTDFSCPEDNGCSTTDGSRWLKLECKTDYTGGDIPGTSKRVASIEACSQYCLSIPECLASSFVGDKTYGECYPKSVRTLAPTDNSGHTDGLYLADAPTPKCPDDNGKTFVANSKPFLVQCGINFANGDIPDIVNPVKVADKDIGACITACANNLQGCQSVALTGTDCYLKNIIGTAQQRADVLGAKLLPCNLRGKITNGITYTDISNLDLVTCKAQCKAYSLAGLKCRIFAYKPTTKLCTLSLGSPPPTFDNAFEPSETSGQFWTTTPNDPQDWYRGYCALD